MCRLDTADPITDYGICLNTIQIQPLMSQTCIDLIRVTLFDLKNDKVRLFTLGRHDVGMNVTECLGLQLGCITLCSFQFIL